MPVTVGHVLTATTPDDPTYEIRPTHWNSAHAITLSLSGSDISAGFTDGGGISFGLSANGRVSGTVATTYAASNHSHGNPTLNLTNLSGTTASNSAGFTLSLSAGNYLTTAAASNHSHGNPTLNLTNLSGTTASASNGLTLSLSADATSSLSGTGALSISANGSTISIGVPNLSIYASSNTTAQSSSSSVSLGSLTVRGAGGVSVGMSAGELVISGGAVGGLAAIYDGANSISSGTIRFTNANGVSFSINGQTISGSVSQTAQTVGLYALGNTTQNSSTTLDARTLSLNALGAMTAGYSNGSIQLSAPATSSLVGSSGLSISTNGSTITAYAVARSEYNNLGGLAVAGAQQNNSHVSYQSFMLEWPLVASNLFVPCSIANVGSAANNSTAYVDISVSAVLYTRNVSTLSSLCSFNGSHTATWSSNGTATVTGGKLLTATHAGTTLTPGNYWIALHVSTNNTATGGANTTALGNTISMVLASNVSTAAQAIGLWGNQTNNTVGLYSGLGIHSTGATRASIDLASITVQGTSALNAPVAFGLRNATYQ